MYKLPVIALSVALFACEPYEAPAPEGPDGSWWVGGVDGGVYVLIEDDDNTSDNIYRGSIYDDLNRALLYRGAFAYSGTTPLDYRNRHIYSGWDGERLYLDDNSYLTAIGPLPSR